MVFEFNKTSKKYISLLCLIIIFISCIAAVTADFTIELENYGIHEKMSNTNPSELSYEALTLQERLFQNRYKDRSIKAYSNDKITLLSFFCSANNFNKAMNNAILKNLSEIYSYQDLVLLYIHKKDGKKHLI